jgi:predicted deacylase
MYIYGDPSQGPTVSLMAGVHGCEYTAMAGLRRFLAELDERQLRGSLRVVPMANITAFWARSPFLVPVDGKNLNRFFPGDLNGTYTERLAYALFENLIRPADYHIDMHAGDMVEDLEPFSIYDGGDVEEKSHALGLAYGLPNLIRTERSTSPIAGTSSTAAAQAGIPSITAEAGGRGIVDELSVTQHYEGVKRVLAALGVLPAEFAPAAEPAVFNDWIWLRTEHAGWWWPSVKVGETVADGAVIGSVAELGGDRVTEIVAPRGGVPLFITSSPAVGDDGLLMGLAVK